MSDRYPFEATRRGPSNACAARRAARAAAVPPRGAWPRAGLLALAAAATLAAASPRAAAQPSAPEDWPCVQVLVPEIVPSVLWPVPIDESVAGRWREDPATERLARRLGDLERLDDEARAAIGDHARAVPEGERREALTRLADGTVSVANERRARFLDGIRRYTRQQIAIAEQIESTLNRLAELDDAADAAVGAEERAEVEETLAWHERLYDQRERSIRALCERPVELERSLAEVLRELAGHLPDAG